MPSDSTDTVSRYNPVAPEMENTIIKKADSWLISQRVLFGYSQSYIAKFLGIHQSTYCRYESDQIHIPEKYFRSLQRLYNTKTPDINDMKFSTCTSKCFEGRGLVMIPSSYDSHVNRLSLLLRARKVTKIYPEGLLKVFRSRKMPGYITILRMSGECRITKKSSAVTSLSLKDNRNFDSFYVEKESKVWCELSDNSSIVLEIYAEENYPVLDSYALLQEKDFFI